MKILLVHGLGRTSWSMSGLAIALQSAGHIPESFGYVALFHPFDDIAVRLRDRCRMLATAGPYGVVTHSLGGVLTRAALAQADFPLPAQVVMLAPPNQSPRLGRWANQLFPYQWFSQQCGANLADPAFYTCLPALDCPYTIIAGTAGIVGPISPFGKEPNDMIVGLEETKMRACDRPLEVLAFHSFIMNHPRTQQLTVDALANPY
ncbi:MAG: alpha/beta hydrolase [Leptolyngbya foveolarum]|uniref:Alpha/beta hydrolase n=1 Tax=Leptolyngbya foveolarum TaxID=47253 RepID=A0A2W4TL02_9CYAN|nr:MAG: alpha/beta hydrolase [Leptolyngbya foveolarum]